MRFDRRAPTRSQRAIDAAPMTTAGCGVNSDAEFGPEQIVDGLRIGLAAG
jgi:hypothetical protein